jgi:hypothetical protein
VAEWADGLEHECSDEVLDDEHDLVVVAASAMDMVVGFFFIFFQFFLPSVHLTHRKLVAECSKKTLDKERFPNKFFVCVLSNVTLGNIFAECFWASPSALGTQ